MNNLMEPSTQETYINNLVEAVSKEFFKFRADYLQITVKILDQVESVTGVVI